LFTFNSEELHSHNLSLESFHDEKFKRKHCKLSKNFTKFKSKLLPRGSNVLHTPESMNQYTSFRPYCVDFEGIYAMNPCLEVSELQLRN
jgi:hypothetical protein